VTQRERYPAATAVADRTDLHDAEDENEHGGLETLELVRIAFVALAAAASWFLDDLPPAVLIPSGVAVIVVGAWGMLVEASENLRDRRMTMELSMLLALLAALATGEVFVALVITVFVLIAEVLEELAVARGRNAIRDLLAYLPATVLVRRGNRTEEVPLGEVMVGDRVLVNPGSSIPVDGSVLGGNSFVDEATITGEPMAVEKQAGAHVFAGTMNQRGALEVVAEQVGRDSAFGKIVEAVEQAEQHRAPVQRTADRYAGYLVYFALSGAALTFLITRDIRATISVIIVAGACGIAAGTPLAILGGIGRAARQGSIVKGGRYLEALWAVDTVVLDKTGTLTYGTPSVVAIAAASGFTEVEVLELATVAELRSEHPLGMAILDDAYSRGIISREPEEFTSVPGRGVFVRSGTTSIVAGTRRFAEERGITLDGQFDASAEPGASEVIVARDGQGAGAIYVADRMRDEAIVAIDALHHMGIRTLLLTGDREGAAAAIAGQLGIDDWEGGMLPEQKRERVKALVGNGRNVAMIGDGVNDAPALAEASVGIAMGSGTDVTRESADVVLIGNDLSRFVDTLRTARRVRRTIRQNFAGTIAIDVLGVSLAAFGLLGPLLAAALHVTQELAFILNSALLLPAPVRRAKERHHADASRPSP